LAAEKKKKYQGEVVLVYVSALVSKVEKGELSLAAAKRAVEVSEWQRWLGNAAACALEEEPEVKEANFWSPSSSMARVYANGEGKEAAAVLQLEAGRFQLVEAASEELGAHLLEVAQAALEAKLEKLEAVSKATVRMLELKALVRESMAAGATRESLKAEEAEFAQLLAIREASPLEVSQLQGGEQALASAFKLLEEAAASRAAAEEAVSECEEAQEGSVDSVFGAAGEAEAPAAPESKPGFKRPAVGKPASKLAVASRFERPVVAPPFPEVAASEASAEEEEAGALVEELAAVSSEPVAGEASHYIKEEGSESCAALAGCGFLE